MAKQSINIGTTANDGTGDPIRTAMGKINDNFTDLYDNYQSEGGLSANVATLTSNNTSFVGTVAAANVVSNAQLIANLALYAPKASPVFTGQVNAAALYVTTSANVGTFFTVNSTAAVKSVNSTFSGAVTSFTGANTFIQNKLQIGDAAGYNFGTGAVIEIDMNSNTYQQIVMQNANTGTNASGDLVVTADNGTDSVNYVDLGINGSGYSNALFTIGVAGDAYLYASNGALAVGTASVKDVVIHSGGTLAANRILTVNTMAVTVNTAANLTVLSNTFNLGSSTNGANGYTYLPNGFKMNWGWVSANSTAGNATFTAAYTTNAYAVTATSNSTVATYQAAVIGTNTTVVQIRTANATSTNVFWHAIGY
jgi:hypothetical protein